MQKSIICESGEFEVVLFQVPGYFITDIFDKTFNRGGYINHSTFDRGKSIYKQPFLCRDIRRDTTTPRRVVVARMIKRSKAQKP